jgi:hypothetical protein
VLSVLCACCVRWCVCVSRVRVACAVVCACAVVRVRVRVRVIRRTGDVRREACETMSVFQRQWSSVSVRHFLQTQAAADNSRMSRYENMCNRICDTCQ